MTSLQDGGRVGSQRHGVSRSGAMDRRALAYANAVVGNPPGCGAIEFMLAGGTFEVADGTAQIAVAGAPASLSLDGEALRPGMSATLRPGQVLSVGAAQSGVFSYLAVAGGFDVRPDLGSISLQPRAAIGGIGGRAFRPGDVVALKSDDALPGPAVSIEIPALDPAATIRVVLGPQADYFDANAVAAFLATSYTVSPEADRMGYRLAGPPIAHLRGFNIVSDGLVSGSVQVPGSGVPIVMMADHQTTGGYPKIATVISADLGILAQRRTGDTVRFEAIAVEDARVVFRERAAELAGLAGLLVSARSGLPSVEELLGLNLAGQAADALAEP